MSAPGPLIKHIEGLDPESLVQSDDSEHPANMIPELCREFYKLGWVTGTGGGISIRVGDYIYLAPSGVQKERIKPEHIFVLPFNQSATPTAGSRREFLRIPKQVGLKESACTPLFWNAFRLKDAKACIHTHSQNAVMLTLLHPHTNRPKDLSRFPEGTKTKITPFTISHQEMIKGIRIGGVGKTLEYQNELIIPIIENTPKEEELCEGMEEAMRLYPEAGCVLVRRHGVYVWGPTWESAKTQAECLDYLFEMAVRMRLAGMPLSGGDSWSDI